MNHNDILIDRRAALSGMLAAGAAPLILPFAAHAADKFRFITPFGYSLSFSAVLFGKTGGFYKKEGLDVQVIGGKGAAMAAQMTIANQSDVGRTGGANFIVSRVKNGAPLKSIATIAQVSPFFVISPKDRGIEKVGDFKGKTFGMASLGGSMENTLNFMLRQGGVDPKSVNKVKVADTPAAFGLIEAKRIDGFMGNVSTTVKLLSTDPRIKAIKVNDGIPGQVYVAREADIEKNADQYIRFLRATIASATEILNAKDLKPILKSIGSGFKVRSLSDMDNAARDLRENAKLWSANGMDNLLRNVPETWAGGVKMMMEAGMLPAGVKAESLYTNALWDKARGK
ncbi:MAG: ABC transporter substrate-binding protein [Hyphomicrobiales bacterium]|nr:ABC transporter substrate-binding protein [Hyphomicrobiales bacterium]